MAEKIEHQEQTRDGAENGRAGDDEETVEQARDEAYDAKVQRRVLRFLNDATNPGQLMVAPHDRIAVDEAVHHTSDHLEQVHREPERLMERKAAEGLLRTRDRQFALGLTNARDLTEVLPRVDFVLPRFGAATYGRWDLLYDIEADGTVVEIEHAALLHTSEVVFLADGTNTMVWDPSDEVTPRFALLSGRATGLTANLLCGGHAFLSDGRLLVVGGGGFGPGAATSNQAWKFDPVSKKWTQAGNMATRRWYPTVLTLGDETGPTGLSGRVLVAGGHPAGPTEPVMEVYSEATDTFTPVTQTGRVTKAFPQTYPGLNLLPGGELFYTPTGFGNCSTGSVYPLNESSAYFQFSAPQGATDGAWTDISGANNVTNRTKGMSVILLQQTYPFVRVVVVGGGDGGSRATAQSINLSTFSPSWSSPSTFPDGRERTNVNVVVLPDSKLLVSGGTQSPPHTCYLYDPGAAVNPWREMDDLNAPRHYHSCALLLPSGKVMLAGGAAPGGCTSSVENTIEVFSPPYLFNPDGSLAPRPAIAAIDGVAPGPGAVPTVHHGATFVIETPEAADVARVVLVRPMAVTHQTDTEQRVIQVAFARTGPSELSAVAPDGVHPHALAPRGYYMVFVLNTKGVPSEGKFIHLH